MKLDMEVKILTNNSQQALVRFKELKQMLAEEESTYNKKASQYGNKWRIQPSNQLNRQYYNEIEGSPTFMQFLKKNMKSPALSIRRSSRNIKV